jgi:hypothetical protein
LRDFYLHRERFDHFSIHCENRETIVQKMTNSVNDSIRDFSSFHVVYQFDMWHCAKNVRYVQTQQNDHSICFLFSHDVNLFDEKFYNRLNWSISFDISWMCRAVIKKCSLLSEFWLLSPLTFIIMIRFTKKRDLIRSEKEWRALSQKHFLYDRFFFSSLSQYSQSSVSTR